MTNVNGGVPADEPTMIEKIQAILVETGLGAKVGAEDRISFLARVEALTQAEEKKSGKERRKYAFQVQVLRAAFLAMVMAFCGLWWRVSHVEEKALAEAYIINIEKLKVGGMAISKAMEVVLGEVAKWVKEASDDMSTTPEDRSTRLGNLERLGGIVQQNKRYFDAIVERCNLALKEAPPKIDASTILTDPFTGVAIPLNATRGGRLDESVVTQVLGNEKVLMAYLVLGKQYGGRGAKEMPTDLADVPKSIQLDPAMLNAVGLKAVPPEVKKAAVPKR